MPRSRMLDLALGLQASMKANLPALIAEINTEYEAYPAPVPVDVLLGIRTEIIGREATELPVCACGVYTRSQEEEGEQEWSSVIMPFVIEVFLADTDPDSLYIQATKYALVFDNFVERYCSSIIPGFTVDEAPDIEISYVLELRGGEYRQLVTATALFMGIE